LEQDIAISNIALDLLGQARNFYQYAATLTNDKEVTEDTFAYLRDGWDFKNCLLVEQPNGDWAHTIARQFFFSAYQYYYYEALKRSRDEEIAAIAARAFKEVTYHLRWSSEWVIRLGDGTDESHERMQQAINNLWPFAQELFTPAAFETEAEKEKIAPDLEKLKEAWLKKIKEVLKIATINLPGKTVIHSSGKEGKHGIELKEILKDLQYMQRTYPGCEW